MKALIAAALVAAFSFPALAAPCLPKAELERRLALRHQERPAFAGVATNGVLLRVYTTPDGSTWTVAVELPNRLLCVLAAGEGWRAVDSTDEAI